MFLCFPRPCKLGYPSNNVCSVLLSYAMSPTHVPQHCGHCSAAPELSILMLNVPTFAMGAYVHCDGLGTNWDPPTDRVPFTQIQPQGLMCVFICRWPPCKLAMCTGQLRTQLGSTDSCSLPWLTLCCSMPSMSCRQRLLQVSVVTLCIV